jgi:hypothetical protein
MNHIGRCSWWSGSRRGECAGKSSSEEETWKETKIMPEEKR